MCPSTTFTRWHCALTANLAGVTRPASREPRIFRVSRSIFSSSSGMNGTTLSVMSRDATPGYPAPEMACSVVTTTAATPNRSASGARASAIITVEQLGFATMNPPPVALQRSEEHTSELQSLAYLVCRLLLEKKKKKKQTTKLLKRH